MMPKLGDRELEVVRYIAWGASQKEVADQLGISPRTVDNTVRHVKEKLKLQKSTELSAWWFCTTFGISFDLSPLKRRIVALCLAGLLMLGELKTGSVYCSYRGNIRRVEWRMTRKGKDT